jgi:hypothetical protein
MQEQNRITSMIEQRVKNGLRDQVKAEATAFDDLIKAELQRLGISEYEACQAVYQLVETVRKLRTNHLADARLEEIVNGLVASSESKSLCSVDANGRVTPKDGGASKSPQGVVVTPGSITIDGKPLGEIMTGSLAASSIFGGSLSSAPGSIDASIARLDAHNME